MIPEKDQSSFGKNILSPAANEGWEDKHKNVKVKNLNINLLSNQEGFVGIYFFSLNAKAEAGDEPLKTGSEIDIGRGFVFSI